MNPRFFAVILLLALSTACSDGVKSADNCGDGFLDPGEACDRSVLGAQNCQELGYYEQNGDLACNGDCTLDTSACALRCGDEIISAIHGEECEGVGPVDQTCEGLGLGGGSLSCNAATCKYDRSACESQAVCGDHEATTPAEQCDSEDLAGQTCVSLGYHGGDLACNLDCTFSLASCESFGRCGDAEINEAGGEDCDSNELGGQDCEGLGYYGGTLACTDCAFDVTSCELVGRCGDNTLQAGEGEVCDGTELAGQTCEGLGWYGGDLACAADCGGLDLSSCEAEGRCGDDDLQAGYGEACDGTDLDGQTCEGLGWHGGDLACAADCGGLDLSSCEAAGRCGDGLLQSGFGEVCDAGALAGQSCLGLGWYGGTLACESGCAAFDTTSCETFGRCGDGIIQTANGEQCDGANLDGDTCYDVMVFRVSGTLGCDANCHFDTTGCKLVNLVDVPGGTFQRDATPANTSTVPAFMMGDTEITRAQFSVVMGTDPSYTAWSTGLDDPVQQVSWYAAIAFCNKASLLDGLTPVYSVTGVDFATLTFAEIPTVEDATWNLATANWSADGYRLPTEMEWMWAAMGASDNYAKPFSGSNGLNLIGDYAVFGFNTTETGRTTVQSTSPVKSRLPNELGIYDLSGNVMEWLWDRYFNMPVSGPVSDYKGPTDPMYTYRGSRGGDYGASGFFCAVARRTGDPPELAYPLNGFRVVRR